MSRNVGWRRTVVAGLGSLAVCCGSSAEQTESETTSPESETAAPAPSSTAGSTPTPAPPVATECESGLKLCDGRCYAAHSVVYGCGEPFCDPCPVGPNATAYCSTDDRCALECDDGLGDCDGIAENGCEEYLSQSLAHCGGCDQACAGANVVSAVCALGACSFKECAAGYYNADRELANGCESTSPCPEVPGWACDLAASGAVCYYEDEDECVVCSGVGWRSLQSECWTKPDDCPYYDTTYHGGGNFCSVEGKACCYTWKGEPAGLKVCDGEEWIRYPLSSYDNYCL